MILQSHSQAYLQRKLIQKDTDTSMSTAALFIIAKTWKQPKCPLSDEWIKQISISTHTHTRIHNGILLSHKNEIMPPASTWVNLEIIIPSEVIHTKTYYMMVYTALHTTYMWNVTKWYKWTFFQNRRRLTDLENKLRVTKGDVRGEVGEGAGRCIRSLGLTYIHCHT